MNSNIMCHSIVIKGLEKDVDAAIKELDIEAICVERKTISDNITSVKYSFYGDMIDTNKCSLFHNVDIKYIFLGYMDGTGSDVAIYKDFGNTEFETFYPYTTKNMTVFAEELEGETFFLDEPFKEDYEDYSCGEIVTIEYTFPIKEKWENDSLISNR